MATHPSSFPNAQRRDAWRPGGPPGSTAVVHDLPARLLRIAVPPVVALALVGVLTVCLLAVNRSAEMRYVALCLAVIGFVIVMIVARRRATAAASVIRAQIDDATRDVGQWINDQRASITRSHEEIQGLVAQIRGGERITPSMPPSAPAPGNHPFAFLAYEIQLLQHDVVAALVEAAEPALGSSPHQRIEMSVNFGRRMQSLTNKAIIQLDDLEREVENPDLLKGLFDVDHLVTRMRRQAESLSVLAGARSRRQWDSPVPTYEVLRSAVSEVEHYARVRVVPIKGTVQGWAAADMIHLLAEFIENATNFSATRIMVQAQPVTAGLAVEVEDRGLGVPIEQLQKMNDVLGSPRNADLESELLQDGRMGLCVVSALAHQHGVAVQLRRNLFGGTTAVIVLPHRLLGDQPQDNQSHHLGQQVAQEAPAAVTANVQRVPATSAPPHRSAFAPSASGTQVPTPGQNDGRGPHLASGERRGAPSHLSGESSSIQGSWRPPQPVLGPGSSTPPPSSSVRGPAMLQQADNQGRPTLPQRSRGQFTSNFPEPGPNQPTGEFNPSLMADFQQGIKDGTDGENSTTGPSDRAN